MAATMAVPFSGSEAPTIRNDNFGRPLTHSSIRAETDGYLCEAAKLDLLTATAYSYRGAAKSNSGDQVGAIADCRHAIELDPKNANAYRARAHTRASQGDYTGAIADLDQAIQLDPLCADAYRLRGEIKDRLGDFEGALAAYLQSIRFANDDAAYSRFWVCLIGLRLHRGKPQQDLAAAIADWKDGWPRTVGRFLVGKLTETDFMALAGQADPKIANEQQCEACYYAGMLRHLQSDDAGARYLFQRCMATGVDIFSEFGFARTELGRLDTKP